MKRASEFEEERPPAVVVEPIVTHSLIVLEAAPRCVACGSEERRVRA